MRVSGLDFRSCYWDDEQARASHKRFLKSIHELDLQRWQDAGCWDKEHYLPYSLFDKTGGIVSTVCVFLMDLVVGGRELRVGQFSGVGTAPEWRRRGLGDWLSRRAMSELSTHVHGYYLFADQGAVPFYQQMGFVAVSEQRPHLHDRWQSAATGSTAVGSEPCCGFRAAAPTRAASSTRIGGSGQPNAFALPVSLPVHHG